MEALYKKKQFTKTVNSCYDCPDYKILMDIDGSIAHKQKESKKPFEFPVGFCKNTKSYIYDFSKFPDDCKLPLHTMYIED